MKCDSEHTCGQLIRTVDIQQPDWQWQYQLKHERDVTAQAEAALALEKYPTPSTRKILTDIIENEQCFFKVILVHFLGLSKYFVKQHLNSTWRYTMPS